MQSMQSLYKDDNFVQQFNFFIYSELISKFVSVNELFESFKAKTEPAAPPAEQAGSEQLLDLKAGLKRVSAHPLAPPTDGRDEEPPIDFKANLKKVTTRAQQEKSLEGKKYKLKNPFLI